MIRRRTLWGREPVLVLTLIPLIYEILAVLAVDAPMKEAALTSAAEILLGLWIRSRVTPTDRGVTPDGGMPLAQLERKPSAPVGVAKKQRAPVRAMKQIGRKIRMSGWDD